MGRRGPPKTPTNVLKWRGSWRGDERQCEPQAPPGDTESSITLSSDAQIKWDDLLPRLDAMGVLGSIDGYALARYCETYALWVTTKEYLILMGTTQTIKDAKTGVYEVRAFPQVAILTKLESALSRLEQNFGLTPSARANLAITPNKGAAQGRNRFFAKNE